MNEHEQALLAACRDGCIERRDFLRWSAVLGFSVPLRALSRGQATAAIPYGGTLKVTTAEPATIEPPLLIDPPGTAVVQPVGEYLVAVGNDLIPRPHLATGWTPSEAGKTWTFTLRQDVRFHTGKLMSADDVVATFKRLVGPASISSAQATLAFLKPEGVRKVDDFTVAFDLTRAVVDFPYYVCNITYQAVILPAGWPGDFAKNPVGTGPFKLVEYVPGQRARYVRNPDYWQKGLPYLNGLVVLLGVSPDAQTTQLLGGSADMQYATPGASLPLLRNNPAVKVLATPSNYHNGIFVHTDTQPFSDKRVRQAMALCLNRPDIITSVLQGYGEVGNDNVISSVFPLYSPIAQRRQDYAKARDLLRAAGYPHGFSATLTTASDIPDLVPLATVAQQMWKPVGIDVKLKTEPGSVYFTADWLQAPLTVTQWGHRSTPSQILDVAYRSGSVWNASHWSNPAFDRLTSELDATLDFSKRKAIVKQIELLMTDEVPSVVPAFGESVRAVRANVEGVEASSSGTLDLTRAFFVPTHSPAG
jgi:peptide/nickel transport system substrate-binding protein